MQAPIIAAIIGGSVSILIILLQYFSNRKLNKELEMQKKINQLDIESSKIQLELFKNIEVAKQQFLKEMTNQVFALRKSVDDFSLISRSAKTEMEANQFDMSELQNSIDGIQKNVDILEGIYRGGVYLNKFFGDIIQRSMHDILRSYSHLKGSFRYATKKHDGGIEVVRAFEEFYDITKKVEKEFKDSMFDSYSRMSR